MTCEVFCFCQKMTLSYLLLLLNKPLLCKKKHSINFNLVNCLYLFIYYYLIKTTHLQFVWYYLECAIWNAVFANELFTHTPGGQQWYEMDRKKHEVKTKSSRFLNHAHILQLQGGWNSWGSESPMRKDFDGQKETTQASFWWMETWLVNTHGPNPSPLPLLPQHQPNRVPPLLLTRKVKSWQYCPRSWKY